MEITSRSVTILGSLVDDLIEGGENVVTKLNFSYAGVASDSCPDGEAKDSLFGEGGIEHSVCAVALIEAHGATEDSSELYILPENLYTA